MGTKSKPASRPILNRARTAKQYHKSERFRTESKAMFFGGGQRKPEQRTEEQQQQVMSFLVRSRNSQKWGRTGSNPATASFSVRTGRRASGESDSVVPRSGTQEPVRDCLAAAHFLRNETQAARTAVEALDKYILKLASFQDKALEVIEEAHRALSRLERAVALSAAPELIVVACEIKVLCHRGLHLFRTYGKYRYLGKVIALATHSSITAKFDAVIGRLTAIMPLDRTPSFTSIKPIAAAVLQPPLDTGPKLQQGLGQRNNRASLDDTVAPDSSLLLPQQQQQQQQQQHLVAGGSNSAFAAAGSSSGRQRGAMRSSADATVGSVTQTHGAADGSDSGTVLSIVLRSSEAAKVTCISFVDTPGASTCVWWAAGDRLEFYSTSTQSTTSFAPHLERAAITAVAVDNVGNIWCANSKGAVMMRQQRNWEQVFVEHAFSSGVRCLATDADSDVVWAGDEAGRLAVFRFVEEGNSCHLECTATILPGRAGAGLKNNSSSALLDVKPKTVSRWHALSCRRLKDQQGIAEGPIRTMLVRDDRAWVGGGRTDPWIGLFDAVLGTQLDMWSCDQYGSCLAMTSMLTSDALAETSAAATAAAAARFQRTRNSNGFANPGLDVPTSVPEDNIGEDPRSGWRLITGHENGQLLLWNAASDRLQPVIKIGEPGLSPVKSLCVMEEQGLLAVVHANGELALFLRPTRDRDWLMGPTTTAAPSAATSEGGAGQGISGGGAAAAGAAAANAGGSAAGGQTGEQLSPATSTGTPGERVRSGGGSTAAAGLTTIKPRRVVLKSHRSMLVAAAACSSGVVTASALGSIKLWPADGLGKEAERCGLLPSPVHVQATREASLTTRSGGSLNRLQQPMTRQNSDSLVSNARSSFQQSSGGSAAAAADPAAAADSAALLAAVAATVPAGLAQQAHPAGMLQQQLDPQQEQAAALLAWQHQQQQLHPQDGLVHQQLYGMPPYAQVQQQQPLAEPNLARLSEPGVQWLQQQQQSQQALFITAPGGASGVLPEQLANPLVLQQQMPLERRSAPLDIPWQASMVGQPAAAASPCRGASMGTAMIARLTAQHQLGQLGGSPRFSNALLPDSLVGSAMGAPSAAGSMLGESPSGGYQVPQGAPSVHDVPMDSGPRYAAPRAPKAMREIGMNRERRRSERRLSKGANIAWSTCQIINASELRMLECIGGGAYGQVFLAEWMGTQVAAKQLLSFQNKAKDAVTKRKANERAAQQDCSRDDADSDSDSDTDSVDSVEEEVAAELKQLMDEVWVLGSLSHPSITRFCALCLDPPMIVMQYYPHGSLFDLLKRGRRGEKRALHELTWPKRLDMLRDIASGMVFLHSRKPPIVHGDLRSPNLLLDLTIDRDKPRFHVKIADFGLARMVGPTSSIAVSKVTNPRWSAPEVLRNSVVSLSADVFSFGVVMWELLTWQQPYEDMMSVQVLFSVMQNYRPEIPADEELPGKPGATLPRFIALMERCWAEDEHARPSFEEVLAELDDLRSCELGHARLRGGDSQRSLHGSTRVSYSEAPGTPTGSCLGSSSRPPSAPGSNISSAPNSNETGPIALAAAAAAGAAAASIRRRQSTDGAERQASGARGLRGIAASDPGTPTGSGMFSNASTGAPTRLQLVGGSAPTSGSSTSSGSSGGTNPGSCSSPGALGGPSELSFAMARPGPVLAGVAAFGPLGAAPGPTSPGAPMRTPSRLGPSRCSSTMGSPTAITYGMAVRHEVEPVFEHSSSDLSAGRPSYQRRNSGSQTLQASSQQSLAHTGSRLRRLSWGTLEGSLQSSSSKQLGMQPSRASWGGSIVHEYYPAASMPTEGPLSPFTAAQADDVGAAAAAVPAEFTGSAAVPGALPVVRSPYSNPFASLQAQKGGQDSLQAPPAAAGAAGGPSNGAFSSNPAVYRTGSVPTPVAAASAAVKAPAITPSPFAAVQQDDEEPPAAAAALVAAAVTSQAPARPCSPFAAAQRQSTGDDTISSSVGQSPVPCTPLMASRQGTDDSTSSAQPPARPSSPFAAVQAPADALVKGRAASLVAPVAPEAAAVAYQRPSSPFAAAQEQPNAVSAGPAAPTAAAQQQEKQQGKQPAAPADAGAVARPPSPFAAAPQLQEYGPDDLRVESLSGSPFVAAGAALATLNSNGSSSGSCPAAGVPHVPVSGPSRFGAVGAAGQVPSAQAAGQHQPPQQQQQQAGARPSSPFASVQAAAVQGPVVAQQAKAVLLSRLNSQAYSASTSQQEAASTATQQQQQLGAAPAAVSALVGSGASAGSPTGAAVSAHGGADFAGAFGGLSGDSITFPSGLGAVESVVFMRGPVKRPQPRQ